MKKTLRKTAVSHKHMTELKGSQVPLHILCLMNYELVVLIPLCGSRQRDC
jgi:hypothetical protein